MKDEVFEKIKSVFVFTVDNEKYVAWITPTNEEYCKKQLKQILEEIESDAFKRGVSKLLEIPKDIEVELIKLKEAKIQG